MPCCFNKGELPSLEKDGSGGYSHTRILLQATARSRRYMKRQVEYTPTIRLKTTDGRVLEYEGDRSLDDVVNWVRRNAKSGSTRTTYAARGELQSTSAASWSWPWSGKGHDCSRSSKRGPGDRSTAATCRDRFGWLSDQRVVLYHL